MGQRLIQTIFSTINKNKEEILIIPQEQKPKVEKKEEQVKTSSK